MSLNAAQQQVVETARGPLLVLAGAGTGKTRVVTFRTARLIERGIKPERILAVTFTNKAAREMQERIGKRLGGRYETKPEISTFHSLCVRILRRRIHHLGYPNLFSIYDRGDAESVARATLRDIKTAGKIRPGDLVNRISQWKSASVRAEQALDYLNEDQPNDYIMAIAYGRYQNRLRTLGAVDFDDLLLLTEDLFTQFPDVLKAEAGRFDHLLVDEYQDTNLSQYRIVKGLAQKHRNLCVVGDDDQAIYGWRGAEVTHILNFKNDWPDAKVVRLEINYRSTAEILDWANRVIAFNAQRHAKTLKTTTKGMRPSIEKFENGELEAEQVVADIKKRLAENKKLHPRDFAILFRTNEQPRPFEFQLREQKIPYSLVGGQSFFDRKEIKDVIAYLKTLASPRDTVSLLRIVNTPPRGIGDTTIRRLNEQAALNGISVWEAIEQAEKRAEFDSKTVETLGAFRQMILAEGAKMRKAFSPENLEALIERVGYRREIERMYPDESERNERWNSVGETVTAAAAFCRENRSGSLRDFLDSTALGGPDFASGNDKKLSNDAVALMTYHAAKGLEFREVYMVGLEEGILPHKKSIADDSEESVAEERRLCYVGITRAQRRLTLTRALNRLKWGKERPTLPSRFIFEIIGQAENPLYLKINAGEFQKTEQNSAEKKRAPSKKAPQTKKSDAKSSQSGTKIASKQGAKPVGTPQKPKIAPALTPPGKPQPKKPVQTAQTAKSAPSPSRLASRKPF